ncbi:MAG: OmpH family outer membrane protein [Planctomycetota bacterium]
MKFLSKPVTLVLAAMLVAGALAGTAASQAVFAPAKIGFVEVTKVFQGYRRVGEIEQRAVEDIKRIDEALMVRFNELKKRSAELGILLEGTAEYRKLQRELEREKFQLEWDQKDQKEAVARAHVKGLSQIYTEIKNEAENFARRSGLNGVFLVNVVPREPRNPQELQMLIASHPVLYWDKGLDLTDEILKIMNGDLPEKPVDEPEKPGDKPADKPADSPEKPAEEPK